MAKKPISHYPVTVWNEERAGKLILNFVDQWEAHKAVHALERQGLRTDWQSHGYTIYQTADEALEAVKFHVWD